MKHLFILTTSILLLASCTYYTEKQSEALSQNTYATSDSLNNKRVDLAYYYSNEAIKLVKQPKHRISIQPVYEAGKVIKSSQKGEKTQVVIVPDKYKGDKIVVVGSTEYQDLLKDREIRKQLEKDNANLLKVGKVTQDELKHQQEMHDTIIKNAQTLQTRVYKLEAGIWKRNVIILILSGLILGYIWLRASRFLFF
jgi:hypothetical protein